MSENWYSADSWYAPLNKPAEEKKKAKKKKTALWRTVGAIVIVLSLIIGTSVVFGGKAAQEEPASIFESNELPENRQDFFDEYYTSVTTDKADINIPRAEAGGNFRIELKPAPAKELSLQELYQNCSKSIVGISGFKANSAAYSWGTGIILSEDGLILTNTHVIDDCDSAVVTLYDDTEFEAMLVGADSISDIAVLKINAAFLPAAEFGDSGELTVGDRVAAIGNPLGDTFRLTLTDGIISAIERGISYNGHSMNLLQTNTALNEGNSGGALFNMYGQIIGVTNMKMMSSYSSIEGIGFAIPSVTVQSMVDSIIQNGEVRGRTSIGITVGSIPENALEYYDLPNGLYVSEVKEGTDAKAKGIAPGDIIIAVNSIEVSTTDEVLAIKNQYKVGDILTFTVWRDGETFDVDVMLMDTIDVY